MIHSESLKKPVFEVLVEENELKPVKKVKNKLKVKIANKLNRISNPRYYENARTPKKAKMNRTLQKVDILSNFNFI
ncbi:MAG: hypothetical protein ACTSSC_12550 [Promethearchaeota archaeon]